MTDVDIKCAAYEKCLGRIQTLDKHYSDHEGVYAEFKINSNPQEQGKGRLILVNNLKLKNQFFRCIFRF